ncbi:phage tail assembly chaperone [Azohydromonas aeria]|uniref:phage tail assembly chaperone n=1 Tax=Azohydromonas aeria TaxID=2590212 RepID=UPI0012F794B2|nr:phage tail assembly chaperone [Azohydromonas aeria]
MPAKITLTARPGPFTKTVAIPTPEGEDAKVSFIFKYRTRKEFAKFMDAYNAAARERAKALFPQPAEGEEAPAEAPAVTDAVLADAINESGAQYLIDVAEGWGLDEDFTLENAQRLVDMYPGTVPAVAKVYGETLKDGRSGN